MHPRRTNCTLTKAASIPARRQRGPRLFGFVFRACTPASEIKSNFKFKTLKRHLLKRHLTLSEIKTITCMIKTIWCNFGYCSCTSRGASDLFPLQLQLPCSLKVQSNSYRKQLPFQLFRGSSQLHCGLSVSFRLPLSFPLSSSTSSLPPSVFPCLSSPRGHPSACACLIDPLYSCHRVAVLVARSKFLKLLCAGPTYSFTASTLLLQRNSINA